MTAFVQLHNTRLANIDIDTFIRAVPYSIRKESQHIYFCHQILYCNRPECIAKCNETDGKLLNSYRKLFIEHISQDENAELAALQKQFSHVIGARIITDDGKQDEVQAALKQLHDESHYYTSIIVKYNLRSDTSYVLPILYFCNSCFIECIDGKYILRPMLLYTNRQILDYIDVNSVIGVECRSKHIKDYPNIRFLSIDKMPKNTKRLQKRLDFIMEGKSVLKSNYDIGNVENINLYNVFTTYGPKAFNCTKSAANI